jgi:hypothetical protein
LSNLRQQVVQLVRWVGVVQSVPPMVPRSGAGESDRGWRA